VYGSGGIIPRILDFGTTVRPQFNVPLVSELSYVLFGIALADSDIRILCLEIALADNHVLARLPVA
jgi:hypothetical protein